VEILGSLQQLVLLALGLVLLGIEVFAFVEASRAKPEAYLAAGKRTKGFWLGITGVALALGFVSFLNILAFSIFAILAIVAAGIFLADVRPALQAVQGRGRGTTSGPYGPW